MLSGETLETVLYAIATGYPERAKNRLFEVGKTDEVDDETRERLSQILWDDAIAPADQARRLGDALRELGADRALANECYRLAFYLTSEAVELAGTNELYAFFLANRAGRILDKWVHYFPVYDRHLRSFRGQPCRVLEIGVYQGGSLDMWSRYLGPEAQLVGIDIEESAARLADSRRPVLIGDQADPAFLQSVVERHGPFDIVIDDGGHTMEQQITSIQTLFPTLNDNGVYLVEDCHTSYWDEFGGGYKRENTFVEWVKDRVDDLHAYHRPEALEPVWAQEVDGVHCYDSVVVFDKGKRFAPFNEQIGGADFVYFGRPTSVVVSEMLATRDAAVAERDATRALLQLAGDASEEEYRLARGELAELRPRNESLQAELQRVELELTVTRNDLLEAWEQVQALRGTVSWRITAPIRALRRRMGDRG
ncbi:MAG: class I SAM-dependent methyltransferase [Acidimicrobiales bacterium]